jgi:hypothetical protein
VLRDKTAEALDTLEATWRHQLVEFSPYNATSSEEALRQLVPAQQCVATVWRYYYSLVNAKGAKAGEVDQKALDYIKQAFSDGKCTPSMQYRAGGAGALVGPLGMWPEVG